MNNQTKPKWHDLLVFQSDGTQIGSVKELLANNPEGGRQRLHDCLIALRNLGTVNRFIFVPPTEERRWRTFVGEGGRLRGDVDWDGFEWHLTTDDMNSAATAVLALALEGRDAEVGQAVFQAVRSIAEIYQNARGGAVYAELNQIAYSVYVPRGEVAGDGMANWHGKRVRAHLTEVGRLRFPTGLAGRLSLNPKNALEGVEVDGHELGDAELHGFARLAGDITRSAP